MARYCVSYDTMYKIHQLTGQESQEQLVSATCIYFKDLKSRKVHHDLHSFLCMNLIITAMHIDSRCCRLYFFSFMVVWGFGVGALFWVFGVGAFS